MQRANCADAAVQIVMNETQTFIDEVVQGHEPRIQRREPRYELAHRSGD